MRLLGLRPLVCVQPLKSYVVLLRPFSLPSWDENDAPEEKERRTVKEDGGGGGMLGQKQTRKFNVEITLVEGKKSKALSKGLFSRAKKGGGESLSPSSPNVKWKDLGLILILVQRQRRRLCIRRLNMCLPLPHVRASLSRIWNFPFLGTAQMKMEYCKRARALPKIGIPISRHPEEERGRRRSSWDLASWPPQIHALFHSSLLGLWQVGICGPVTPGLVQLLRKTQVVGLLEEKTLRWEQRDLTRKRGGKKNVLRCFFSQQGTATNIPFSVNCFVRLREWVTRFIGCWLISSFFHSSCCAHGSKALFSDHFFWAEEETLNKVRMSAQKSE